MLSAEGGDVAPSSDLVILYRDDSIVAVHKPGGLLCHRSSESADRRFLLQELRNRVGAHVYPVHRLDRAASGAIVFALSSEDAKRLQESLAAPSARKRYLALARGECPDRWECDAPLSDDSGTRRPAHTSFEKVAEFSRLSLLVARISTGRRHQIRRHLARCAHQILGDTTYGKGGINRFFRATYGLPRMFLHSWRVTFRHPRTGASLDIQAPLADDLRAFLRRLPDAPRGLVDAL